MATDIPRDLAATGRMTDMDRVIQIEMLDEFRQVIGISVHVIAVPRLARPAMTATIMGDAAIAMRGQEKHLILEGVGA